MNKNKLTANKTIYESILVSIIVVLLVIIGFMFMAMRTPKETEGAKVVKLLYNFDTIEQLAVQDYDLEKLTTESAYKYLTVTNSDRALNTYLKFNKKPTEVQILREGYSSKGGYVLYTLNTTALSAGRKFLFMYDLEDGLVTNPREMECIDFKTQLDIPSGVDDIDFD
ncbi:MAG: hypothetical protein ACRC5M_07270 [Anaeroplasmataceae bacterium]